MGNAFWFEWEPKFIIALQSIITPALEKIAEFITFFGDEYSMILVLGFVYWGYNKELGKKLGIYAVTALITSVGLNNIVMRRRPYFDHPDIQCLKPRAAGADPYDLNVQGYSFPSGHATNSMSIFAVLGLNVNNKALKILLFSMLPLIGLSRLALGVHYPTDVLAGWALTALIVLIISRIKNINITYMLIILLGIAGCFVSKSNDYYSSLGIALGFIAAFIFEEKFVNFENTKNVFRMVLRTLGGVIIFIVFDQALKLPFSEVFLTSGTMAALLVRSARYMIVSFLIAGIYPMLFGFTDRKMFKKK